MEISLDIRPDLVRRLELWLVKFFSGEEFGFRARSWAEQTDSCSKFRFEMDFDAGDSLDRISLISSCDDQSSCRFKMFVFKNLKISFDEDHFLDEIIDFCENEHIIIDLSLHWALTIKSLDLGAHEY
ncbi:MAG: hypothetical protein ACLFSL_05060 [Candidatus Woesearchaeota archaeon]